jgi:hypothetical protein
MKRAAIALVALLAVPPVMAATSATLRLHNAPSVTPASAGVVNDCCLDPTCPPDCSPDCPPDSCPPCPFCP